MTYRLTGEWVGLKRQQRYPSIDHLNPNTFSVDWNQCVLVRILDGRISALTENLEFEFVGDGLRKDAPGLSAGARVSDIPGESLLALSLPLLPMLFERQTAVICSGCQPWRESGAITFHAIAIPFGDNLGTLKYALGAISHNISCEAPSPQDIRIEFMEYCDGGWCPCEELPEAELIRAA